MTQPTDGTPTERADTDWADAIAVEPLGERRFRARLDPSWNALQGVNGGLVAATTLNAVEHVLAAEGVDVQTTGLPATSLRAATFGYVSGTVAGEVAIEVDIVRRGRALVTSHARTVQDGKTTMVARFHHSSPWEGLAYSDAPAMPARPAGTVVLSSPTAVHFDRVETHLHPATVPFGGAARAEWMMWSRPRHGGTFDSTWLTMYGDYPPPAVFARTTGPSRAVSIEYAIQIHTAGRHWTLQDGAYLTARLHAFHSHDGFAVEDGWIWLPDGTLLATTRQTRLAG